MIGDLEALFLQSPIHRQLGLAIERVDGGVRLHGAVGRDFARADGLDTIHGGVVSAVLDSAATLAVVIETERAWATVDLRVDYLRPTPLGEVEITGDVVRAGATIARARASLVDDQGRTCALAIATFAAQEPRP